MKKINLIIAALCFGSLVYGQVQDSTFQSRRWANQIQIGQMLDGNDGVTGRASASWTSGIEVNKVFTGLELGFNDYGPINVGSIAIKSAYSFFENDVAPYGYGMVGYGNPLYFKEEDGQVAADRRRGGVLYGIGWGIAYPIGKVKMLFQMGYKFQEIVYRVPDYSYYYYYDRISGFAPGSYNEGKRTVRKMNRVEFKIGILF